MRNISIKDRIALYYLLATGLVMALVFGFIYFSVYRTVWANLDWDLSYEAAQHTNEIMIVGDTIMFVNKQEWEEREHKEPQVNPVFIQLMDSQLHLMDKSPNLKEDVLPIEQITTLGKHFDGKLKDRDIRLVQVPLQQNGVTKGYIVAAMSSTSAIAVISRLRNVLGLTFPFLLGGLFFVSRYLAGISILPIQELTGTATRITKSNLQERLPLPANKDEIYELADAFNNLLSRIERAMKREKQFTSDASHELRTPLASIKGTLEVLVRKTRSPEEYQEKINYCLKEMDRVHGLLEQLLLLARMDTGNEGSQSKMATLPDMIEVSLDHFRPLIEAKQLQVHFYNPIPSKSTFPAYYLQLVLGNILSNAIKYTPEGKAIYVEILPQDDTCVCTIRDEGIGIRSEDLAMIYDNFFRSDPLGHRNISGNGLGLSIARKAAEAIQAKLEVSSVLNQGTTVSVVF
jgi:signal transduction histidine kinase